MDLAKNRTGVQATEVTGAAQGMNAGVNSVSDTSPTAGVAANSQSQDIDTGDSESFDIYQVIFDDDGESDEQICTNYNNRLYELFMMSPEAQQLRDTGVEVGWTYSLIEYGTNYAGATVPNLTLADLRDALFDYFPRKVSVDASRAPEVVAELRSFWLFLQRVFSLKNAAEMIDFLDEEAAERLREALGDESNFGMAKSFFMGGKQAGFDMTSQEGLAAYMQFYNAQIASRQASNAKSPFDFVRGATRGAGFGSTSMPGTRDFVSEERQKRRDEKKRQRQAKARNRK